MRIEILSKNYSPGEKLKDIIVKKVEKLDKFFEEDTKAKIMLKQANDVFTLEITIVLDGGTVLRAEVSSDEMYNNIDLALPKLEKQIVKHHSKLLTKSKKNRVKELDLSYKPAEAEKTRTVVKSKTYELAPMTVEDAIEELELVGHSFFVFANKDTNSVNVVYKRNDDDYGLIETVV